MAITDITKPMALDETLQATNGKMDSVITKLQGIIDALGLDTSVYKPKGNIACAQLVPALLIESNIGNVYNVTDNGTTTSDFAEGAGKPIHVGDNVAIVDIGTGGQSEFKFDLLAGMVDLSNYVEKEPGKGLSTNDYDNTDKAKVGKIDETTTHASGNPISISGLKSNQLAVNPIITLEPIQAGSGTPSPSNIRAISGYDKIEVLSGGKNLFDKDTITTGYRLSNTTGLPESDASYCISNFVRIKANTTYYVTATSNGRHWFYDVAKNPVEMIGSSSAFTYTPTADGYIRISIYNYAEKLPTMQITQSSTAQSYEPYNKTTDLSLALGQTVYGGSLDLRTGKLAVTHIYRKFNGTENWTWYSASNSALLNDALTNRKGINSTTKIYGVCNVQATSSDGSINYIVATATSTANLQISQIGTNFGVSDVSLEGWKTWLATNNLEFTYELATPIEIQLTPHEISLLKDYAYVSTNGTNISLDYHNGELASLSDVAQLSETVERLTEYIKGLINNA